MWRHCRAQILPLTTTYWLQVPHQVEENYDSKRADLDGIWRSYMIKYKECRIL
jgi:hypothetical protein